ncbi:MAG: winged helix-turn-helix domain-containing protein [Patescibacteria group bacterium]
MNVSVSRTQPTSDAAAPVVSKSPIVSDDVAKFAYSHVNDKHLKNWLKYQRENNPTYVLLVRFNKDDFSNERLETLLDLGFDGWVIDFPTSSLVEKISARITNTVAYVSSKYGRIKLQGDMFYRDEKKVKLTTKEAVLLKALLEARGKPVGRAQLLSIHGYVSDVVSHTVETHIYRIRKKLQLLGLMDVIFYTQFEGYQLLV